MSRLAWKPFSLSENDPGNLCKPVWTRHSTNVPSYINQYAQELRHLQRKESFLYLRRQGARELDARFARFNQRVSISEIRVGQTVVELQGCGLRQGGCGEGGQ